MEDVSVWKVWNYVSVFHFLCDILECQELCQDTRENQSLFRGHRHDSVAMEIVYLYQRTVGRAALGCHEKSLWGHDRGDSVSESPETSG